MAQRNRCVVCGKVAPKWSDKCKTCQQAYMDRIHDEAKAIVEKGICPRCGSKLVRNLALFGWHQCVQYGRWKETHGDPNKPNCGFQCFTE